MEKESDQKLLQLYLSQDSEEAFRVLVDRRLPLVHSVAQRVTANTDAASDIAQKVFLKLVQRGASLPSKLPLISWLHRETHSASVDYVRSEVRRQRREHLASETMTTLGEDWREISPVIDQAVDSLSKDERAVVLLRFYDSRSFPEIAKELGITGDAARMRANRALEKLRGTLVRHQVATSSALLAVTLSSHAISVPPAALAASIANAVIPTAKISTPLLTSLYLMTKSNFLALAAVLVAVPIIGFQQYRLSSLKSENELLQDTSRSQPALTNSAQVELPGKSKRSRQKDLAGRSVVSSNDADIASSLEQVWSLIDSGFAARHPDVIHAFDEILEEFPREEVFVFCREMEQSRRRTLLVNSAMRFYGGDAPLECFEFASNEPVGNQPALASAVISSWFESSPDQALDWFLENELKETPLLGDSTFRDSLSGTLARGLVKNENYDAALGFVEKLTGSKRQGVAIAGILSRIPTKGLEKFGSALLIHPESRSIRALGVEKIASRLAAQDIESGKEWASNLSHDDPTVEHAAIEGVSRIWMKTDAVSAATWWVQNGDPENSYETYAAISKSWVELAPIQCAEWLDQQSQSPKLDGARAVFSRAIAERDLESAKAWAQAISDENLRAVVERELQSQ